MKYFFLLFIITAGYTAQAEITVDTELSYIVPSKIEVRIPGDTGTLFEASEIGEPRDNVADRITARIRVGWQSADEDHEIFVLAAPLMSVYEGSYNGELDFFGETFSAGEQLTFNYVFNSYRLNYRYTFYHDDSWKLAAGAAVKVRDAYIEVVGDGDKSARKDDLGFVPLISVLAQYNFNDDFSCIIDADGLASPQGRAFDIMAAFRYSLNKNIGIRLNYRFLDGGADNDEVYNFSFFNYFSLGFDYNFYD